LSEKREDNLREPKSLPTAKGKAESKGPPKAVDATRAAEVMLYVGLGLGSLLSAFVIVSLLPADRLAQVESFFGLQWLLAFFQNSTPLERLFGLLVLLILIVAGSAFMVMQYRKGKGAKRDTEQAVSQPSVPVGWNPRAPTSERFQGPREQLAEMQRDKPKGEAASCKLCGKNFHFKVDSWLTLFLQLQSHWNELEVFFDEFPDREFASEMLNKWFEES
jgi:hypothetical protein